MRLSTTVFVATGLWTVLIGALHFGLNLGGFAGAAPGPAFRVGFLPVT